MCECCGLCGSDCGGQEQSLSRVSIRCQPRCRSRGFENWQEPASPRNPLASGPLAPNPKRSRLLVPVPETRLAQQPVNAADGMASTGVQRRFWYGKFGHLDHRGRHSSSRSAASRCVVDHHLKESGLRIMGPSKIGATWELPSEVPLPLSAARHGGRAGVHAHGHQCQQTAVFRGHPKDRSPGWSHSQLGCRQSTRIDRHSVLRLH